MKYIFDFDDVLFYTSKSLKDRIYKIYEQNGVSREQIQEYVKKEDPNGFSLKKLLKYFSMNESLYEEIMADSKYFTNQELLEIVKNIGVENCFIITYGNEEFQKDKIQRAGITNLFSEIIVVLKSKKEAVEEICRKFSNEKVFFIDDRVSHFKNLDFKKYPNLKTILYTGDNNLDIFSKDFIKRPIICSK